MNPPYPLLYCVLLLLLFSATEVLLVKNVDKQMETDERIVKLQDRYRIDDPDDLIEDLSNNEITIPYGIDIPSDRVPRETTRDTPAETTTALPSEVVSCDNFEKEKCKIKGLSDFNAHYQVQGEGSVVACITDSDKIFDLCLFDSDIKKKSFPKIPVVPVMKLENKRVLEVGSKFFFVDKSNSPIDVDPKIGFKSSTVSRLSVRFSGDCKIDQISMAAPYMLKVKASEALGYVIKNIKDPQALNFKTISGDSVVNFKVDELDGNHFFLCGDKSSFIKKVDVPVRNCISRYSDEPKKIFFCTNFSFFKWLFVMIIISFPITWFLWKTRNSFSVWYDIIGILTYPVLLLLNYSWIYFPFKCKVCGSLSFLSHECSNLCVCNQSEPSKKHAKECYLFSKDTTEWKKLSLIDHFQFTINTKISNGFLILITKLIIAAILISYLPSSLAMAKDENVCVERCYFGADLKKLTTDKDGSNKNALDKCECIIGELITETVYREGVPISRAVVKNDCHPSYSSCRTPLDQAKNLFACRNGCNALSRIQSIPDVKYSRHYKGIEYSNNLTSLKVANRLRNSLVDNVQEAKLLENKASKEIQYYSKLKIDDIPPKNLMPRQSLVFSTEVDGKYRYLIEMDIKSNTGTVFLLNDDTSHLPMEFMIYVKSVGVEYDIRYKYSTAKVDTTVTDYLVTCTGTCDDCRKQKAPTGRNDFCIMPTSWWGCEELGCLAINEGAICGHCTNVFDLSSTVNVYQVVQSHVTAEICIQSVNGYDCRKHTDRVPIQTDYYQLDMTVDLHNDFMSTDKLFAITKQQKVLTGNIADLGDFSSSAFGHPQINIDGDPLSVPASLKREQFSWSCTAIGEKKVNIKQCGLSSYNMIYSLAQSKDFSLMNEETNKLYMTKDFLVGKLKVVIDMPKEMFKKVPVKPILSETKITCSGCSKCAMGIDCNLTYTSDTTFSSRLLMNSCSFKSDQIGSFVGPNKKSIKVFCSEDIASKTIVFVPEDQEDLTVQMAIDEMVVVEQDTIISYDDKSAHDENIHHSDTSISSLWDWIKAPFNWVASFFGNFFDFIRIILVILAIAIGIYIFSYVYRLSKSYYLSKRTARAAEQGEDIEKMLLKNYTGGIGGSDATRRRSPPKTYDFSLGY
nr:MAG: glycoprotein [Mercurialis orthotospovirus 1]